MYKLLIIKRNFENILLLPFIAAGRLYAFFAPLKREYRVYYFFPFHHTGGAEKVHYQIAKATGGPDSIIFFTRKSVDETFLKDFAASGCTIKNISTITDNKWLYFLNFFYRGVISGYINRQRKIPVVFNGQSNFGYKLSPWIKKTVPQAELIHAWNTFSKIRIPYCSFYKISVTVSRQIIQKHLEGYRKFVIPENILNRFTAINSRIELPAQPVQKDCTASTLRVLYVGRATREKRPILFFRLAHQLHEKNYTISFEMAGDVCSVLPADASLICSLHGDITDGAKLQLLYNAAHVLIIPSSTESGPLVLMEAMAAGCAIISTPVGIVPEHVQNDIAGFVTDTITDEAKIVAEMQHYLLKLYKDRYLLQRISQHNIQYAYDNFSIEQFYTDYKKLFANLNPSQT